ncbi:MAG: phosphoribosylanthranilate isomerase [bacterium]
MYSFFDSPVLQAAGVRSLEDARTLCDTGFRFIGFPLRLAFHPQDISEKEAKDIIARLPRAVHPVLITYETNPDELTNLIQYLDVNIIQIHSDIDPATLEKLKSRLPGLQIIKSLIVKEDNLEELKKQIEEFSLYTDAFITDTYDFTTGACGATGKKHNWKISRKLVKFSSRPVILAGGLNPQNVVNAIATVESAGVDVHTGIEDSLGFKDPELCRKFVKRAMKSFGEM